MINEVDISIQLHSGWQDLENITHVCEVDFWGMCLMLQTLSRECRLFSTLEIQQGQCGAVRRCPVQNSSSGQHAFQFLINIIKTDPKCWFQSTGAELISQRYPYYTPHEYCTCWRHNTTDTHPGENAGQHRRKTMLLSKYIRAACQIHRKLLANQMK